MFQTLFSDEAARRRHSNAPFANERERYLQHCAELGGTLAALRRKSNELLWLARHLDTCASRPVDLEKLQEIVRERKSLHKGISPTPKLINIARPWLRFLGWWRAPGIEFRFQDQLDRYVTWMRDERGFSPLTVERWQAHARMFLQWCEHNDRQLSALQPSDVDGYFVSQGTGRWSRRSVSSITSALRVFLRHAATHGVCDRHLAAAIRGPRVYEQESLPYSPAWSDVRRILADTATDKPRDVRDRAILMLLAIYGLRRGEVASLRLEQIDWCKRVLRLFRLKRRQAQVYPLLPSVAEALARYVDTVRPQTPYQQVFIRLQGPRLPMTPGGLYHVASRRFLALGIQATHRGPHALRHACAARLLTEGLTLKEIGDHLGHRSTSATRTYTKVDLISLREVGDFDLGDLP
jgi:integrase/recombinase XerD